ncbi:putative AC transposase, partial [Bienertia sinuspersici]
MSFTAPGTSSTPIGVSRVEELNDVDEVELDDDNVGDNANVEGNEPPKKVEVENPFQTSKRPRRSKVWDDYLEPELIKGKWKVRYDEWEKLEKVLRILKVFKDVTNIISGSKYLTTNLFLSGVRKIKVMLDNKVESPDEFVRDMVQYMKQSYNDDDEESGMQELLDIVRSGEMVEPLKSELDTYLDDGLYNAQESKFDVLAWWKEKYMKYPILSK